MIGYLSRYAPGRRENGGVYTHAATWAIWAYSKLKMNELGFEAYKKLSPIYNGLNPDEYVAEPFVTPEILMDQIHQIMEWVDGPGIQVQLPGFKKLLLIGYLV